MNKKWIGIILSLIISLIAAGCGGTDEAKVALDGAKELNIAISEEIQGTDIAQVNWENVVHELIYNAPVTYDLELKNLLPASAESFSVSPDGKEISFTFPAGGTFSNGEPLNAQAIKDSMDWYIEHSPYSGDFDPIEEIVVKDENTLVLRLEKPTAFLWPVLTSNYNGPNEIKAAKELGKEAFNRAAVGNGLYCVEEWVQGSHITLVKNPFYKTNNPNVDNKGPAKLDKVTVRFIPESFTRISEIESGTVDIIYDVPLENIDRLEGNDNIQMYKYLQSGVDNIFLNPQVPHLDNLNVRKAIALAIDKPQINEVLKNTADIRYGIISPAQLCYDKATEEKLEALYSHNLEKAKELLAQAGYKDENGDGILEKDGKPLKLTLMVALDYQFLKQSAPMIQAQLQKAGINLELKEYDSNYIKQMMADHNFEMAMRAYTWPDPDILYYNFHTEGQTTWSSEKTDKLLDDARYTMDPLERTKLYSELQMAIAEEVPVIPLLSEYKYLAARKNIRGIKLSVLGQLYPNDIEKD